MFGQWCVADGEGVAAAAVVAGDVEDEVVDVAGDECDVAALATAREPPSPRRAHPLQLRWVAPAVHPDPAKTLTLLATLAKRRAARQGK
jgi:hypothetical protein